MKKTISDLPDTRYRDQRVFVRVDFNVPITDGRVQEDYRLRRAVPTIEYLCARGAKVILASHLGKPKGTRVPEFSLKPVADRLRAMVGSPIRSWRHRASGWGILRLSTNLPRGLARPSSSTVRRFTCRPIT